MKCFEANQLITNYYYINYKKVFNINKWSSIINNIRKLWKKSIKLWNIALLIYFN